MICNKVALTLPQQLKTAVRLFLVSISAVCGIIGVAKGQTIPPQSASANDNKQIASAQFAADLKALSQQWKVAFVAEGQPLTTPVNMTPPSLDAALSKEEAVKKVADYYDYEAVQQGHVFVLTKRYANPDDLPDITLEECSLALKAVSQILTPYNPRFPPGNYFGDPMAAEIVHLLTSQQMEALSREGVPVASLSEVQRAEIWRVALSFYLQQHAQGVEAEADFLASITRQDPLFHWKNIADVNAFGFDAYLPKRQKTMFLPLSHPRRVNVGIDGTTEISSDEEHNGVPVPYVDPTNPMKASDQDLFIAPPVAVTLKQVMADLNVRTGSARRQVEPVLEAKRVTIVGQEKAAPSEIMNALAAVYGLRVLERSGGILLLARPQDPVAKDLSDLGRAVRSAIPTPMLRAFNARIQAEKRTVRKGRPFPPRPVRLDEYWTAAGGMRVTAIRELRALAEPKVKAAVDKKLPLSRLGEQEKKLFAAALAVVTLADVCGFSGQPLPSYLADFDHVVLTGGLYHNEDNEVRFSLNFSYSNRRPGIIYQNAGFSNARLP